MANQMIMPKINLLKLPDPAAQTAKYANMMNAARQQEAAELQASRTRQEMDYATAEENRKKDLHAPALTKAQQDNAVQALEMFRNAVGDIAEGDVAAAEAVRADLVSRIPGYDQFIPPASQWTRDTIERLMMTSEQEINKLYATPTTETIFGPDDKLYVAQKGGLNEGLRPLMNRPAAGAPAEAPRATPTAPQMPNTGADMRATRGANTTPQDLMQQGMDRRNIPSGMPTVRPASFSPGASAGQMTPQRAQQIVDSAVKTRVMAQEDFDQLIAMTPEQNKQPFMDMIRTNNITLQPGGMGSQSQFAVNQGQRPQADFAVNRGATPAATLAQTNVVGQQAYGRSASPTSPLPGSSLVAPKVLGSQKAAETAGAENVKVGTEPRIVAGTERAKRLEKLRGEMPIARAETQTLVNSLTGRINAIDEYLRSGSRNSIIGAVEGRIPRFFQSETRADAQGLYDYITSNTVLQKLIDDRGQTETGGSPQGVVSDADLKIAAQASTKLTQTGSERKQEIEMQRLRDELHRTREQAIQKYNNVYREIVKEAPELRLKVRTVAPKYKSAPQTSTKRKPLQNIFGG
jgi:hypothetical protein